MKLAYRPEIDGLRGIAILSVILYHAKIILFDNTFFKGGFIGVDIFFVISGYLITALILKELKATGQFSFLHFYGRRVRRIIPVLFFVMLSSLPVAWIYLIPASFSDYSKSILSSIAFSSNFYFHYSGSQYGADNGLLIPFLHTWSLSVEEQFYIVFPIILLVLYKYFKNHLLAIMIIGLLLSLQLAEWGSRVYPSATFYFLPSRMWELLAGATLAYFEFKNGRIVILNSLSRTLPTLGLLFISYSIIFYDDFVLHPSFLTVLPISGVCLIIWYSHKDELITKILSSRPFVWVGLISYSLYLWHYPVFAFSRIQDNSPSEYNKFEWIMLTVALSILSYFLIEKPFRNKTLSRKILRLSLISSLLALLVSNSLIQYKEGFRESLPGIFSSDIFATSKPWLALRDDNGLCDARTSQFCTFNKGGKRRVFITGDSHMASIMWELKNRLTEGNYTYSTSTLGGCWYLPEFNKIYLKTKLHDTSCNVSYQQNVRKMLIKEKGGIVILGGRLPAFLSHEDFNNTEGGGNANPTNIIFKHADNVMNLKEGIVSSIKELLNNYQNVILIYPIPEVGWHVPKELFKQKKSYLITKHFDPVTTSYDVYKKRSKESFELLDSFQHPNLYRVYPHTLFCNNKIPGRCITHTDKDIFYGDGHHLSLKGSELVNELIMNKIETIERGMR